MTIDLNDKSLITSYVQIVLRDFSGLSVKAPDSSGRTFNGERYEITSSNPIKVTGTYDLDTYAAASLFMAINYPNEQFPCRYDTDNGKVIKTPYDRVKLKKTIDWIKSWYAGVVDQKTYNRNDPDVTEVFDWETFLRYFSDLDRLEDLLSNKSTFNDLVKESLLNFIVHNIDMSLEMREVVSLSERILSYFFNEVVTPSSERDEIYRVQKILYQKVKKTEYGIFTEEMTNLVKKIQEDFIKIHTMSDGSDSQISLPEGFDGFKVTGYVDPWTEMIINGGVR